jgi:NAD+ synthase (glutamine-hydrolysing)
LQCRVGQYKEGEKIGTSQELANRIFTTVYMGTVNSGSATKDRARNLAKQIGADHLDVKVDIVIDAMAKLFEMITGKTPKFRVRLLHQLLSGWVFAHCLNLIQLWG